MDCPAPPAKGEALPGPLCPPQAGRVPLFCFHAQGCLLLAGDPWAAGLGGAWAGTSSLGTLTQLEALRKEGPGDIGGPFSVGTASTYTSHTWSTLSALARPALALPSSCPAQGTFGDPSVSPALTGKPLLYTAQRPSLCPPCPPAALPLPALLHSAIWLLPHCLLCSNSQHLEPAPWLLPPHRTLPLRAPPSTGLCSSPSRSSLHKAPSNYNAPHNTHSLPLSCLIPRHPHGLALHWSIPVRPSVGLRPMRADLVSPSWVPAPETSTFCKLGVEPGIQPWSGSRQAEVKPPGPCPDSGAGRGGESADSGGQLERDTPWAR